VIRFDPPALYSALDAQRSALGLTWGEVSAQCGVAVSTIVRLKAHGRFELVLLAWLWYFAPVLLRSGRKFAEGYRTNL
jgi:hypothetical protein